MDILHYLKIPLDYLRKHDARRPAVEQEMLALLRAVHAQAISSRRWTATAEVEHVQNELGVLFDSVVLGYKSLEDFKKAVERWEALGSKKLI